jgi:superoxide dismutase, Fe-Mn family
MKDLEKNLQAQIRSDLGLEDKKLSEAYVTQAKKYNLSTELLSSKTKKVQQEMLNGYVETLNHVAASLDTADRDTADSDSSKFRSLKIDEAYNLNGAFLFGMHFENISDPQSQVAMDSLSFMRLERDFGTFDVWQKDFIACALSSRSGWVVTVYNGFLNRYMNCTVDSNDISLPINAYPVLVLSMHPQSYVRDYLEDKKAYVYAMMQEFNWGVIEDRFKKSDKISRILR